jgi:peptidoglycan/LPS O-acetylase OafA/YrhL
MSVKEGSSFGFVDRLEALRGVAALAVAVGHSMIWLIIGQETALATKAIWEVRGIQATIGRAILSVFSGAAAVDIFFVLSGFVLTMSIFGKPPTINRYLMFAGKRLFRILPTLWFALLIVCLYLWAIYPGHAEILGASDWFTHSYQDPLSIKEVAENARLAAWSLDPNAWTLKVELLASALLPLMVYAMGQRGKTGTALVFMVTLLLGWLRRDAQFNVIHYLYMFVIGAAIAKHGAKELERFQPGNSFIVGCLMAILTANICFPLWHPFGADILVVAGSAGLIWAISSGKEGSLLRILDARWARFLGRISYSFYLLHFIVLYAVGNMLLHVVPTYFVLRQPLTVMLASCVLSIGIAIPIAAFAFRFIEKPFTVLGRQLLRPRSELSRA